MGTLLVLVTILGLIAAIVGLLLMIANSKRKLGIRVVVSGTIVFIVGIVLVVNFGWDTVDDVEVKSTPVSKEDTEVEQPLITKAQYESVKIGDAQKKVAKELGKVSENNTLTMAEGTEWVYRNDNADIAYIVFSKDDKKVIKKKELGMLGSSSHTETTSEGTVDLDDWETQVKDIAASSNTETEKFDAVSKVAKEYTASSSDLKTFQEDVINEYKSGKYLSDIHNDQYMLTNAFKAIVLDEKYGDTGQSAVGSFAFDFLQNTKYTYRGVDAIDSEAVKSNEHQMDKALSLIK